MAHQKHSNEYLSFWDHVTELRKTFLIAIFTVFLGVGIAFCFHQEIISLLVAPLHQNSTLQTQEIIKKRIYNKSDKEQVYYLPPNAETSHDLHIHNHAIVIPPKHFIEYDQTLGQQLYFFSPLEGLLATIKVSIWVGIMGSSPFWIIAILRFILPALNHNEKKLLLPAIFVFSIFLILGVCFAYCLTIPYANLALESFNASIGSNLWSFSEYINYSLMIILSTAAAFELVALLLFLVHISWISSEMLINKRKHAIVAAFVIGAVLTPPDVLTQFLLAVPLIFLFELVVLYSKLRSKLHSQEAFQT